MNNSPTDKDESFDIDKPYLLIVEDDPNIAEQLKWGLLKDYKILTTNNPTGALNLLQKEMPSVVTLDLGLPPKPDDTEVGLKLLDDILRFAPLTKIIVITGNTEKEIALKAVQSGAYDFYCKPIELDELKVIIARAFHIQRLERQNIELQKSLSTENQFENLIGQSPKIQEVFNTIRKVAQSNVPVLIVGESGTGKELVSRSIHNQSDRKNKAFIAINCGAIPENLLESELFGHERGSFTGAYTQQKGKLEFAHKGTLFLDEIGELSSALQVKLLRFLQEKTIERVGGRQSIQVDTRVIAATNKNLLMAIKEGSFREDLYYRLSVITINLPPLRERGDDIIMIAKYYYHLFCNKTKRRFKGLSQEAISSILSYQWPGNIRELENKIKRAVIMAESSYITPQDLDLHPSTPSHHDDTLTLKCARQKAEIGVINHVLKKYNGNITKAAAEIGVSRPTLHDLIRKYKIKH